MYAEARLSPNNQAASNTPQRPHDGGLVLLRALTLFCGTFWSAQTTSTKGNPPGNEKSMPTVRVIEKIPRCVSIMPQLYCPRGSLANALPLEWLDCPWCAGGCGGRTLGLQALMWFIAMYSVTCWGTSASTCRKPASGRGEETRRHGGACLATYF